MHEQNIICSKTRLDGTMHEQTIICRQLFAGHVVGSRPMERKKKMHRMIIQFTVPFNNMRTLKFKAQWRNAFFATVNQMFTGSSQLSTAAKRMVIKSLCTF